MEQALRVVLWVRDDDLLGRDLATLLRGVGLQVMEFGSVRAITRLPEDTVDLIILAAAPSRGDRHDDLVRRIRSVPALSGVPVLWLHREGQPARRDSLFELVGDGIALLNHDGAIVRCNKAMSDLLGVDQASATGLDFFAQSNGLAAGRRQDVPGSSRREFVEWPRGDQYFRVTAAPLDADEEGTEGSGILVVASDITEVHQLQERATESAATALAAELRVEQLERDARLLQQFTAEARARGDEIPESAEPLRTRRAEEFRELVREYEDMLERVLDRITYRVSDPLSIPLRNLAGRLGELGAGPRDVVELHGTALRHKSSGVQASRARALADEGRLLVLELMGHLVSHYRRRGSGVQRPLYPGDHGDLEGGSDGQVLDQALRDRTDPEIASSDRQPAPDL